MRGKIDLPVDPGKRFEGLCIADDIEPFRIERRAQRLDRQSGQGHLAAILPGRLRQEPVRRVVARIGGRRRVGECDDPSGRREVGDETAPRFVLRTAEDKIAVTYTPVDIEQPLLFRVGEFAGHRQTERHRVPEREQSRIIVVEQFPRFYPCGEEKLRRLGYKSGNHVVGKNDLATFGEGATLRRSRESVRRSGGLRLFVAGTCRR